MINQGDSLKFTGYLEKLVNGVWQRVTNIWPRRWRRAWAAR